METFRPTRAIGPRRQVEARARPMGQGTAQGAPARVTARRGLQTVGREDEGPLPAITSHGRGVPAPGSCQRRDQERTASRPAMNQGDTSAGSWRTRTSGTRRLRRKRDRQPRGARLLQLRGTLNIPEPRMSRSPTASAAQPDASANQVVGAHARRPPWSQKATTIPARRPPGAETRISRVERPCISSSAARLIIPGSGCPGNAPSAAFPSLAGRWIRMSFPLSPQTRESCPSARHRRRDVGGSRGCSGPYEMGC